MVIKITLVIKLEIAKTPCAIDLVDLLFRDLAVLRKKSGNVIPTEENTKAAK